MTCDNRPAPKRKPTALVDGVGRRRWPTGSPHLVVRDGSLSLGWCAHAHALAVERVARQVCAHLRGTALALRTPELHWVSAPSTTAIGEAARRTNRAAATSDATEIALFIARNGPVCHCAALRTVPAGGDGQPQQSAM